MVNGHTTGGVGEVAGAIETVKILSQSQSRYPAPIWSSAQGYRSCLGTINKTCVDTYGF